MLTKGQYRVGTAFNPSGDDMVAAIKSAASDLIDLIETISSDRDTPLGNERGRLKALAQTEIESAAMWAVKAATKQTADVVEPDLQVQQSKMAVEDDPFRDTVRDAIREFRSVPQPGGMGATEFVRAALKKVGFLAVSGDDIDEAIISVEKEMP